VAQEPEDPSERVVRWRVPGGRGRLLGWRVEERETFAPGTDLAAVRLPSGAIIQLRDTDGGTVRALHARSGQRILDGDWALTVTRLFEPWRTGLHGVFGTPARSGPCVYAATRFGVLDARVAATGARRSARWPFLADGPLASSPVAAGGCILVGSRDGRLFAVDEVTAELAWQYPERPPDAGTPGGSFRRAPAVGDGVICVADDTTVHILDAATRQLRGRTAIPLGVHTAPVISGGRAYVIGGDSGLYAVDLRTGLPRQLGAGLQRVAPAATDAAVWACWADGTVRCLDSGSGQQRWLAPVVVPEEGRSRRAQLKNLAVTAPRPFVTGPVLAAGVAYVVTTGGLLSALGAADGQPRWTETRSAGAGEPTGLAVAGETIYVTVEDRVSGARTSDGAREWTARTDGDISAPPLADADAVYVTSARGYLYAIDSRGEQAEAVARRRRRFPLTGPGWPAAGGRA
jgi:outer membrane protein assembly factor BamB